MGTQTHLVLQEQTHCQFLKTDKEQCTSRQVENARGDCEYTV